ncbi:MAG TPA: HAD-IA family hydrolase [Candidatus Binatus sp.]|nr:HAD-IA family hydrolase [Candidatus Binatus sp.]
MQSRRFSPLRVVLFDLDGTLIDSTDLIISSFDHTYRKMGRLMTVEQIQADLGMPLRDTLRRYFDADDLERAMATYLAYNLERHDASVRQMAGVAHLVRRLREAGLRLGVVTSKLRDTARRGLTLCHLDRPFEVVVAKEDTARHKPEPEPLIYALAALDAEAQECAYVGDTPLDVEAARRAGVRAVAALWRPVAPEAFAQWEPDAYARTPDEAADILESWRRGADGERAVEEAM